MPSLDYSYDHPTRSTSPLHFLNPTATMSHLTSHCSSHSKPSVSAAASKAADISRLLDPSYLPSSSSRASPTFTSAYVDPNGDLHDPDYRHFPTQAKQYSLNSTYSHSSSGSASAMSRTSTGARRPQFDWEIDLDESALDDEYEHTEEWQQRNKYAPTRSWSTSSPSAQRPRESSFSTTSMYAPTSTYYSPTGTASTLPTSYEDDTAIVLSESPFEEKVHALQREKELKERKHRRRLSKGDREKERARMREERERAWRQEEEEKEVKEMREKIESQVEERRKSVELQQPTSAARRNSRQPQVYDLDEDERAFQEEEDDDDDSAHLHPPTPAARTRTRDGEYVPTCSQSLKRQWQAFALGFRFGVFRAQRRVMRRVASLI